MNDKGLRREKEEISVVWVIRVFLGRREKVILCRRIGLIWLCVKKGGGILSW